MWCCGIGISRCGKRSERQHHNYDAGKARLESMHLIALETSSHSLGEWDTV
jgi:hypothetical protein